MTLLRETADLPPSPKHTAPQVRILCGCLFASGFAALSYEVVWTRLLLYAYGNTVPAMTTVVTAVMAGLGLGSLAGGRIADRSRSPARVYGVLELCLTGTALAAPAVLAGVCSLYLRLSPDLAASGGAARFLFRYGLTLGTLIVPSALMGATLPAVAVALRRAGHGAGGAAARAYGWNTLGAAAGTVAAGYFALPAVGIGWTNRVAALVGLSAGVAALLSARRPVTGDSGLETTAPAPHAPAPVAGRDRILVYSLAVSGLFGMLLQTVWVRALTLVVGSLTYSLTGILVAFLLGIGTGSLLNARLSRPERRPPFGLLMAAAALSALLLIPFFESLPGIFLALVNTWGGSPAHVKLIQLLVVLPVVAVPTTLLGYILPCWAGYLARAGRGFGEKFGAAYAWNTAGAVAGSALAGYLLVPHLGAQKTLLCGVILTASCGMVLTILFGKGLSRIAAGVTLLLSVGAALLPPWDVRLLVSGVYYAGRGVRDIADLTTSRFAAVPYFREGAGATVAVARFRDNAMALIINGKVDAGNRGDMETQVKLAAIPMLLHPEPARVAVIGLGSGVTSGTATLFRDARSVETIEVEPAVAEAARFFGRENRDILRNPRHKLTIGDARSHFLSPGPSYDVVISEPSNPWLAGESDLFTQDFFLAVRRRLAPGGIFCQWLHGYSISSPAFRTVTRTFRSVFPGATLWGTRGLDFLLIGSPDGPVRVDPASIRKRLARDPGCRPVARYFGDSPEENLPEDLLLDPAGLARFTADGPLHTDDYPILEFMTADSLYSLLSREIVIAEILKAAQEGSGVGGSGTDYAPRLWRAGKYHLSRSRPLQAAWYFTRACALGWRPSPDWQKPRRIEGLARLSAERSLFLFPSIGAYRPREREEAREYPVWAGSMDLYLAQCGTSTEGGPARSKTFTVTGLAGTPYTSLFLPLPVSPSSGYRVEFEMTVPPEPGVSAGCAVMEFDTILPEIGQPSKETIGLHRLNTTVGVRSAGNWGETRGRHSFTFRTSPSARMVHIHFFREGNHEGGDVAFVGINVLRIL